MYLRFKKIKEDAEWVVYSYARLYNRFSGVISCRKKDGFVKIDKLCSDYDEKYKTSAENTIDVFKYVVVNKNFPENALYSTG